MNKQKLFSYFNDAIYYLTAFFPFAFGMAVCFGLTEIMGIMFACIMILFAPKTNGEKVMPLYLSFMLIGYALSAFHGGVVFAASIICGILLIVSSFFFDKLKKLTDSPAASGVMLATALTVTVQFTTHYFGIGATGDTVTEMIKSYISLGFHPNWRGVLYGTIVMVIMITFPRKFKKFSKTVSAPFVAIIVTLILNLFLNPSDMASAINEIPDGTLSDLYISVSHISKLILFLTPYANDIVAAISIGIALFITSFYAISRNNSEKNDFIAGGIANAIGGGIFTVPLPYGINKDKSSLIPRISAIAVMLAVFYFCEEFILRIPLHSCAVVIIVGAWQNVKWGELKKAFGGIIPFAVFIVSTVTCLALNPAYGVIIAAVISAVYSFRKAS